MLSPGQVIDKKYRIVRVVGQGGMGSVYEGLNERIGRRVAIKVLHPEFAWMPEIVQRFEREACAAAEIGSEHIVDVLDLGELPDGERYLVMEYLEGRSLAEMLDERKIVPPHEITPIVVQVLRALDRAHAAGIIHRDLKPDNVFLVETPHGVLVKLLDFGVSKFAHAEGNNTQAGYLVGTPAYMAPEQARGETTVDMRADLHSVGVMLYQAVSGEMPRHADNPHALLFKVAMEPHRPLATIAPHVDARFAAIVERALAESPDDRFPTAVSFEDELQTWLGRVVSSPSLWQRVSRTSLVPSSSSGRSSESSSGLLEPTGSMAPPAPSSHPASLASLPAIQRDRSRALVGLGAAALAALAFVAIPRGLSLIHGPHAMSVGALTTPSAGATEGGHTSSEARVPVTHSERPPSATSSVTQASGAGASTQGSPVGAQGSPAGAQGAIASAEPRTATSEDAPAVGATSGSATHPEAEREARAALSHRRAAKHGPHGSDRPAASVSTVKAPVPDVTAPPLPAALEADPQVSPAGGKMRAKL